MCNIDSAMFFAQMSIAPRQFEHRFTAIRPFGYDPTGRMHGFSVHPASWFTTAVETREQCRNGFGEVWECSR